MAQKILRQVRTFHATPQELYNALMDSRKHAKFTGAPAKISSKVGGKFTAFSGDLEGTNLAHTPNKKIVQSWRSSNWPEEDFSRATFALTPAGHGNTKLTFTQSGIPEGRNEDIKQGWITFYWELLAELFSKNGA